jgi:hypothetical protein
MTRIMRLLKPKCSQVGRVVPVEVPLVEFLVSRPIFLQQRTHHRSTTPPIPEDPKAVSIQKQFQSNRIFSPGQTPNGFAASIFIGVR